MSLHPHAPYPIPEETQRVARAAFPRGNLALQPQLPDFLRLGVCQGQCSRWYLLYLSKKQLVVRFLQHGRIVAQRHVPSTYTTGHLSFCLDN